MFKKFILIYGYVSFAFTILSLIALGFLAYVFWDFHMC